MWVIFSPRVSPSTVGASSPCLQASTEEIAGKGDGYSWRVPFMQRFPQVPVHIDANWSIQSSFPFCDGSWEAGGAIPRVPALFPSWVPLHTLLPHIIQSHS